MSKAKQIKTMLLSFKLKKNQLSGLMAQLASQISKKQQSINKFTTYYHDYQEKMNAEDTHTMANYANQQHFLARITATLASEKESLKPLEEKRQELLSEYHALSQKVDGLTEHLAIIAQTEQVIKDKKEDGERSELSITRATAQRLLEKNA